METLYLIKIEPAGPLFFGNPIKEKDNAGNNTSYYLKSNLFPQQAGVLGLLRHLLALQNNISIVSDKRIPDNNHAAARQLIGHSGFDPNATNYGIINGISPIFISNASNEHFFLSQYDYQLDADSLEELPISTESFDGNNGMPTQNHHLFNNYKAKNQWIVRFMNEHKTRLKVCAEPNTNDSVFIESERVGIKKNIKGELRSDAFYKQAFYQMRKPFAFAIYAALSEDKLPEGSCFMPFGKDRKLVKITVQIANNISFKNDLFQLHDKIPNYNAASNRVLLLSPTFITNDEFQNCVSNAISKIQPHGNIRTKLANTPGKANLIKEINQSVVLPAGSILYLKDRTAWEQLMTNKKNYQIAGYNYFTYVNEPSPNTN
jgi:hypothetical protein